MCINSAAGQLKVWGFKVGIFCFGKGKHSKPQMIIHLLKLYEERTGCGHVWMCCEFSSLRQKHLYNAVEKVSTIKKLRCDYNGSTYCGDISMCSYFGMLDMYYGVYYSP